MTHEMTAAMEGSENAAAVRPLSAPQAGGRQGVHIVRGVASIGLARVAGIVIDGFCYVVVARYLGPAEYGLYLTLVALFTLIDLTGDMTLLDVTVRKISSDPDRAGEWVSAATVLRLAMSAAGLLVYAVYVLLGPGHRTPGLWPAAWIGALILPAGALRMPLAAFRARLRMEYELAIMVITRLANLLFFLICIQQHGGLSSLFLAILASRMLLALMAWATLARMPSVTMRVDAASVRHLIHESIPMAIGGALVAIQLKVDILMMAAMAGASIAGLYGAVAQLPEYLLTVPVIVSTPMLPALSRVFADKDLDRFAALYRGLFDAVVIAVLPIAVIAAILSERILLLLFGEGFVDAAPAVPLLMLATAAMWASHATAIAAVAAGIQRMFVRIQTACVVLYLALNWLLIPRFTIVGAAFSRAAATGLAVVLTYHTVKRQTGATLDPRHLLAIACAGALLAGGILATARLPLPVVVTIGTAMYAGALWACSACPNVVALVRERT